MAASRVWTGSLHQTFRLLPKPSAILRVFLEAEGLTQHEVLARLPYEQARSHSSSGLPDPKRYRDPKAVYQYVGLLYEDSSGIVRVTDLGHATRRWLDDISPKNVGVLGRHAAYALAACQLRNPTGAGQAYDDSVVGFPFSYIWRAMFALDERLSSQELNCALFYAIDESSLEDAIKRIAAHRQNPGGGALLTEVITGARQNDRIVPWISLASFGYSLISDKRESGGHFYQVRPQAERVLREASLIRYPHREFPDAASYVRRISAAASLPKDVR